MKKTLIIASLLAFAAVPVFAEENAVTETATQKSVAEVQKVEYKKPSAEFVKKRGEFGKRLKLTDEQKAKAKEIRQKGHEEMKPVMDKIIEKHKEIRAVRLTKMTKQAQDERIAELRKELVALKREAHELRVKNMKEFESILTRKQLRELKKMKKEGKKKFDREFKKHHKQSGPGFRPLPPEAGVGPRPPFGHGPAMPPAPVEE